MFKKEIKRLACYFGTLLDVSSFLLSDFKCQTFPGPKNKTRIVLRGILEIVGGFCVIVLPGFSSAAERDTAS